MHSSSSLRRRVRIGLSALALVGLTVTGVTACSSSTGDSQPSSSSASSSSAAPSSSAASTATSSMSMSQAEKTAGVVRVTHAFGTTEFPSNPASVVAIGTQAVDNLLALGITPTAVVLPEAEQNAPWNKDRLSGVKIITGTTANLNLEDVAAVHPAMIVGDAWRVNDKTYPRLSDIAPTLGAIGSTPGLTGWKPQLKALGVIFDKDAKVEEIIQADDKLFADTRAELPGLAGKTGVLAQYIGKAKAFGVVATPTAPGNSFIVDLGMAVPEAVQHAPNVVANRAKISLENIDQLAANFMVLYPWGVSPADVEQLPGWKELPQVRDHAVLIGSDVVVQGLNIPTPLSRPWVLKKVYPQLKAAAASAPVK